MPFSGLLLTAKHGVMPYMDKKIEAKNEHGQDSSMTATAEIEDTI